MNTPAADIRPILQSKMKIIRTIIVVSRIPCVVSITTLAAISPSTSIVFVVTEEISPMLFELKYPIGRYRRCSAIFILVKALALYPPSVWSTVENLLQIISTVTAIPIIAIEPMIYFPMASLLINPISTYMIAGIFIAEARASTRPITMDSLNLFSFSFPENLKNFARISNILVFLLYGIFGRYMCIPHFFIKRA